MRIKNITNKIPGQELVIMYEWIAENGGQIIGMVSVFFIGYGIGHVGLKKLFD